MFCPNCNALVNEKDLLRSNVKQFDGTDIEYDARCPACTEEIGRMSWGKLTIRADLQHRQPPVELEPQEDRDSHPYCPHCGGELPDDISKLPRH